VDNPLFAARQPIANIARFGVQLGDIALMYSESLCSLTISRSTASTDRAGGVVAAGGSGDEMVGLLTKFQPVLNLVPGMLPPMT
jgi:hypothetical protein